MNKEYIPKRKQIPCEIGLKIKDKLAREGMTQKELALMIGANQSYLSDIIRGNRPLGKYEDGIQKFIQE